MPGIYTIKASNSHSWLPDVKNSTIISCYPYDPYVIQESEEIKSNSLDQKLKEKEVEITQHLQDKSDHMEV